MPLPDNVYRQLARRRTVREEGAAEEIAYGERFLRRFPDWFTVRGAQVLDVGCGLGGLCAAAVLAGALSSVGVDTRGDVISEATRRRHASLPSLGERIIFRQVDSLGELNGRRFDIVFSKESFEHYADPAGILESCIELLRPGGQLVVGVGPFWQAPYGPHVNVETGVPWAHYLFKESILLEVWNERHPEHAASSLDEVVGGLNRLSFERFATLLERSGLSERFLRVNVGDSPLLRVLTALRKVPILRGACTSNAYGIWEKGAN